jgi:hypothetical protein
MVSVSSLEEKKPSMFLTLLCLEIADLLLRATPMIESAETCYYRDVIFRKPHNNFVGTDSEDCPIIITLLKKKFIEEANPEDICAIKRTKDVRREEI